MGIVYTPEQRKRLCEETAGKTIKNMYWEDHAGPWGEGYWVMEFEDGSETSVRFVAELT